MSLAEYSKFLVYFFNSLLFEGPESLTDFQGFWFLNVHILYILMENSLYKSIFFKFNEKLFVNLYVLKLSESICRN